MKKITFLYKIVSIVTLLISFSGFSQNLTLSYSAFDPKCYNSTNGSIVAYANNGTQPYVSYNLTGAATQNNTTGIFSGLAPGTYSVSVTDTAGTTVNQNGIVITAPTGLTASPDVTICNGSSTPLTVSGGTTAYNWTASPSDPNLLASSASQSIHPTQTTTYTVTSTRTTTVQLVTNGDFSSGNVGFDTDYTYYTPNNPTSTPKAYGVVLNPSAWETGYTANTVTPPCGDHTTNTGNMMVVDGSTGNAGNDLVWGENIPVTAGQAYSLSLWGKSLTGLHAASLKVFINGLQVGTLTLPGSTCTWINFSFNWNSGASTMAQIQLFDSTLDSVGNDFALDDISFTTSVTCPVSESVVVTVNPIGTPVISCGTATSNSVTFNWSTVTNASGYTISYSINNGTTISGGSTPSTSFTVSSLNPNDSVKIFVLPTGTNTCFAVSSQTCIAVVSCINATVSVTQQPTCTVPGTIVFTGPVNPAPLPVPTELFISEVTDEDVGSLTYIEIYNGTGVTKNLANYRLKVYNNGSGTPSCDLLLSGTLANNSVVVISVGSAVNQGGVVPNLVFAACGGVNTDDNIRLTTSGNAPIDLWGRTDGVNFTPTNAPGYSYRRNTLSTHPSMVWNPADWTALDPQDYTNVGNYVYQTASYVYSINNGVSYQPGTTFSGLAPGTYNAVVKDLVSGCISASIPLVVNAVPIPPTNTPSIVCGAATTASQVSFDFSSSGQTDFSYSYTIDGGAPVTGTIPSFPTSSYIVTGVTPGQAVVFTITWNGVCTPSLTKTCYPTCTNPVTPTFAPVAAICPGGTLSALPTTSTNGVVGTWSPPLDNTTTTVYNFTPNNGECATTTTLTINVNPNVLPTFTQVAAICSGQALAPLPTTSTNGITGTWSPALSNTAPATYIFTPNAGQCALQTTMAITVNSNATPTFTAIPPICTGQTIAPLPTTSNNGITGTWSPALSNTASDTYTFTPNTGQCATATTTLAVTVNNATIVPTFTAVAPICQGQALAALPTTSNNGITGSWSPALSNNASATYTFTPNAGQCALTTTLNITVNNPTIVPTFTAVAPICTGQALSPLPTTSNNGITGAWSPALDNLNTATYTFTPNAGQCALITTLQIVVSTNIAPTFTAVNPVCTGTALAPLPTTSNNGFTGSWSPALNNTAPTTYTFMPNAGQCATTQTLTINILPKVTPTFTAVAPICSGATLSPLPTTSNNGIAGTWSPALNNTAPTTYTFTPNAGECANTATLLIDVVPLVNPTVSVVESCNSNSVTVTNPIGNNYQYSLDGGILQSSPFFFNLTAGSHSLIANQMVANCNSNALNFVVNAVVNDVVVSTPGPLRFCDPNNDGFLIFDLTQATNSITGGNPYTVTFHETLTDANFDGTSIPVPANYPNINPWTQIIYVRIESNTTNCFAIIPLQLIVDPTPEATTPDDYHLCDYTGGTGFESFDLTTTIAQVLGSIDPTLNTVTFYTSLANAQGPSNAITNVTGYTNTPAFAQTLYVRVETIATGCYDIVELRLVVDRLPNATQPNYPQYSLCDYTGAVAHETFDLASQVTGILLGQTGMDVTFYPSLTAAQNGTIGTSINETNPDLQYINGPPYVQTLGIRITNALTGCYVVSTMDIRVNPLPSPIPPTAPYTLCDGNQDGITAFDLTTLIPALLQGAPYIITFHETLTDANSNGTTIPNPGSYTNINPFVQTIYVRAEDPVTHCFSVIPIELNVNASPMALTAVDLEDIVLCDDEDNNNQDATRYVDLTVRTAAALLPQPLADNDYTVRYYEDQAAAIDGTLPIIPANHYLGSNADTIWVRVEDKVTGCYNLGSFELVINTPLALTTPAPLNECDNDVPSNDQHFTFDLTVKDTEINQGTGYTVTYYPNSPITAGSVAIANPTAYYAGPVQTLGVMVTSPEGCRSYTTLDIRVLPVPTPQQNPPTLPATCEDATGSGVAQLDLTANSAYIINGDPSVTLHYFPSQVDLDANTNEILSPATAVVGDPSIAGTTINQVQYVYITVSSSVFSDYTGRPCYQQVTQGFIINPLPSVVSIPDYQICEDDAVPDGIEVFDLTTQNAALLAGNLTTPVSNYSVAFYEDPGLTTPIANPSSYSNTSNPQNIFVQVTNTTTNCKSDVSQFNILVNPKPILTLPAIMQVPYTSCDTDGDNDGQMLYPQSPSSPLPSLAGYVDTILGTQAAPEFAVEFYDNQADAQAGNSTSALTGLDTYQVQSGRYYIRVTNTITGCYQTASFDVVIEKLAEPFITSNTGSTIACVRFNTTTVSNDLILDSNITAPNYTFNWYADGVPIAGAHQSTYPVTSIGADQVTYTVEAVSVNPPMLGCTSVITPLSTFTVTRSGPAANLDYAVTNAFSENQVITVTNEGYGVYQYSLDDGPRQDSPVFENVPMGIHTVYVWDVRDPNYSCDVAFIEGVQTIDYPHYFTPNGDGIHDTWNIRGLEYQGGAKIYIFDRYGKLIKQISSSGNGWDGSFGGHLLPADDYWFTVEYLEQATAREFKAHFSLKR